MEDFLHVIGFGTGYFKNDQLNMKTLFPSLLIVLLVTGSLSAAPLTGSDPIEVKEIKDKNLFVFKANKKLLGASIEVFHSSGDVVTAQILAKRKMIIDFSEVHEGTYTVVVMKGKQKEEFQYIKK